MMNDATREALELYDELVDELMSCEFTRYMAENGTEFSLDFQMQGKHSMTIERRSPSREAVKAYLLTFRMFIQQHDAVSMACANAAFPKLVAEDETLSLFFREQVRDCAHHMNAYLDAVDPCAVTINGVTPTRRDIMDKIIYAAFAHANKSKRKTVQQWRGLPPAYDMYEDIFHGIIYTLLFYLRKLQFRVKEELHPETIDTMTLMRQKRLPKRRRV
jgi:hypothetical protein